MSINWRELKAILYAIQSFVDVLRGSHILVLSDNSVTVQYIKKQGGTRSAHLCDVTWQILQFADKNGIMISVRHIPGKLNVIADRLSRPDRLAATEWTLASSLFQLLDLSLGPLMIDLFATRHNRRTQTFVSPVPDPLAYSVDALSMDWEGLPGPYAFPPLPVLPRVLQKIGACQSTVLVLIAPAWQKQSWYPMLLELLVDVPRRLPCPQDMLTQTVGHLLHLHRSPEIFLYHGWKISGNRCWQQDFLQRLQSEFHSRREEVLSKYIKENGSILFLGVVEGISIPSLPLNHN